MLRFLTTCFFLLYILSCDDPTTEEGCTISDSDYGVELITPTGGETVTVGDVVEVKWKVNPEMIPDQIFLGVSTTGSSGPFQSILGKGMNIWEGEAPMCMDTIWVVGEEYATVDYSRDVTVHIKVARYNDRSNEYLYDISNAITVKTE